MLSRRSLVLAGASAGSASNGACRGGRREAAAAHEPARRAGGGAVGQELPRARARDQPAEEPQEVGAARVHAAQERALHPPADREGQAHEEEPHAQLQRPHRGARHRARRELHAARVRAQELPLEAAAGDRQAGADSHPRPRPDAARPALGAARPAQPARAADRRELLLRDGRPVPERQHRERQGRHRLERPDPEVTRLRPGPQGLLPRRRPRRPAAEDRLHQGPRDDRDLAHPELQEPAGPGQQRLPARPATTATGSRTSRRSTRTSGPTRS